MEGVGTFFLALTLLIGTGNESAGFNLPLAAGFMLAALMFAGRQVSGAHYNPAISLAVLIQGQLHRRDVFYYILSQVIGNSLAVFIAGLLLRCNGPAELAARNFDAICALIAEFLGVFALAFVFLQTTAPASDRSHPALAMGLSLTALTFLFTGLSGAVFNPAVALALAMSGLLAWGDLWLYFLSGLLGAVAAASVWRIIQGELD